MNKKRERGQWNTVSNPFTHPPAKKWLAEIQKRNIPVIEPFCGSGNLVAMLPKLNWVGYYDLDPLAVAAIKILKRDTIHQFPETTENDVPR